VHTRLYRRATNSLMEVTFNVSPCTSPGVVSMCLDTLLIPLKGQFYDLSWHDILLSWYDIL